MTLTCCSGYSVAIGGDILVNSCPHELDRKLVIDIIERDTLQLERDFDAAINNDNARDPVLSMSIDVWLFAFETDTKTSIALVVISKPWIVSPQWKLSWIQYLYSNNVIINTMRMKVAKNQKTIFIFAYHMIDVSRYGINKLLICCLWKSVIELNLNETIIVTRLDTHPLCVYVFKPLYCSRP